MSHGDSPNGALDDAAGELDPIATWDAQRRSCRVARSDDGAWQVHGHSEALMVLLDHQGFSNRVSVHVAIPNGMDPPEHGRYRELVDRYFTAEAMAAFEPACRRIAAELVDELVEHGGGEVMAALAEPFAVRAQCAFMGWPDETRTTLLEWQDANQRATRARDREATATVAPRPAPPSWPASRSEWGTASPSCGRRSTATSACRCACITSVPGPSFTFQTEHADPRATPATRWRVPAVRSAVRPPARAR
jgi:cytochrome P450